MKPTPVINYIVSIYCGKRRAYDIYPIKFIEEQIKFLLSKPKYIKYATFVFNQSNNLIVENSIKEKILNLDTNIKMKYISRPNLDFSYGAWETGLLHYIDNEEISHSFLIEDDYIPNRPDFLDFYLKKDSDNVSYVASLWRENHASISNGLIRQKKLKINKEGHLFCLRRDGNNNYQSAGHFNQRNYLKFIEGKGVDMLDVGHNEYYEPIKNIYLKYGDTTQPLIIKSIKI